MQPIESEAFQNCSSLESISIPNGVTTIQSYAFQECSSLKSISIPYGVTEIAGGTFEGCTSLTSITIPGSVTDIGSNTFKGCTMLKEIYSQNPTPPNAEKGGMYGDETFDATIFSSGILYVPIGSKEAYQSAEVWKEFTQIEEMDFSGIENNLMENVTVTTQNGAIVINGVDTPTTIEVYSLSGQQVYCGTETTIAVNEHGAYIVKVGNRVVKVVV